MIFVFALGIIVGACGLVALGDYLGGVAAKTEREEYEKLRKLRRVK